MRRSRGELPGNEGLLPVQQAWFDRLMTQDPREWPQSLREHVDAWQARTGDEICDAVGTWVKAQRD